MIINATEKQVLQKYYAERIKSLAANLKEIVQRDQQEALADTIGQIIAAADSISGLQRAYQLDQSSDINQPLSSVQGAKKC